MQSPVTQLILNWRRWVTRCGSRAHPVKMVLITEQKWRKTWLKSLSEAKPCGLNEAERDIMMWRYHLITMCELIVAYIREGAVASGLLCHDPFGVEFLSFIVRVIRLSKAIVQREYQGTPGPSGGEFLHRRGEHAYRTTDLMRCVFNETPPFCAASVVVSRKLAVDRLVS